MPKNTTILPEAVQAFSFVEKTTSLVLLSILNASIIIGNSMVIAAVIRKPKLRTINGMLITSLAIADLCLGILVLPFSIVKEVLKSWVFGSTWCNFWLQLDVFLCTASIYNLVMISFDRFMAITRPLAYRVQFTKRRGRIMILIV